MFVCVSESCLDKWCEVSSEPCTCMCAHPGLSYLSLKKVIMSELSRGSREESFSTII